MEGWVEVFLISAPSSRSGISALFPRVHLLSFCADSVPPSQAAPSSRSGLTLTASFARRSSGTSLTFLYSAHLADTPNDFACISLSDWFQIGSSRVFLCPTNVRAFHALALSAEACQLFP
jgi:hypothetical protein